jgi:uncharacterized protein (TIGR03437 family)
MPAAALRRLAFLAASALTAQVTRVPPSYSAATIVNAASQDPNTLAPYTVITINGANLAWSSYSIQPSDIRNSTVPIALPNAGVHVYIRNEAAGILSVSPTSITVLVPGDLLPGPALIQTVLDSLAGPQVLINLQPFGPGLFVEDDETISVSTLAGVPVTSANPLNLGDTMVVRAVGLGNAYPPLFSLEIPTTAARLDPKTQVLVYLDDVPIDPGYISSITFIPGQPGIYQLTILLPPDTPTNPELRISANGIMSVAGYFIPVLGIGPPPTEQPSRAKRPVREPSKRILHTGRKNLNQQSQ